MYKYPEKTILQQPFSPSSAEVMPESFVLCFTKLIHPTPSFSATTVLGNSWTLKAEVEGQQPFMTVDAPQRRWACWTSHLEGEKQFPFSKGWHSGERRPMTTTSPGDLSLLILAEGHHNSTFWGPQPLEQLQVSHASRGAIIWKPLCHANRIRKS